MYTEGFEGLEEAEKQSRRTYGGTNDSEKILRENEKLKKSLEKEQFFNKLLDQEIQELKTSISGSKQDFHSEYWSGPRGVSKGAFYMLLVVTLVLGGYIGYGIYYNKPMNYLNIGKARPATAALQNEAAISPASAPATSDVSETPPPANTDNNALTNSNTQPNEAKPGVKEAERSAAVVPPVAKDSVPTIINQKKPIAAEKARATTQKASVTPVADEEYNEEEVNAAINEKGSSPARVAPKPVENRAVIAKYKVTSKANFYNSADENTMRGTFISGDANKTVDALDDKNGFIFVEYTNDLGFTSKGWLSKTDLTKE